MDRVGVVVVACVLALASPHRIYVEPQQLGRALFVQEWVHDASSTRGDGLGPLFNDTSCVACHNLGGAGGAGPRTKNVELVTRKRTTTQGEESTTAVLHYFHVMGDGAEDEEYDRWRSDNGLGNGLAVLFGGLVINERNPPPLFGAGLIDQVSAQAIVAQAAKKHEGFPAVTGRVARTEDGRLGRFGWKGEVASLPEFVARACATEIGLDVPGMHQLTFNGAKVKIDKTAKLDLGHAELNALTGYVALLPQPDRMPSPRAARGERVFESVGCSACHVRKLGAVDGLYSDLLLHDMGPGLSSAGGYYGMVEESVAVAKPGDTPTDQEWRTPPLWGVRDSGPYLHNGRAVTLDEAIRLHGGEALASRTRYIELTPSDRRDVIAFLKSLVAPTASQQAGALRTVPET